MDLYTVMENRRSIRKYKNDPVDKEVLKKILNAARIAPSWKNGQCWKFIVVTEPKIKAEVAASLPPGNPAMNALTQAPVVVVLCADPQGSGNIDGKEYYLLDAGLAMHQLVLAAFAEGLGTCWVALFDEKKARAACGVPDSHKIVAMTPLGVPEHIPGARPRKGLPEIVYAEQWGRSIDF